MTETKVKQIFEAAQVYEPHWPEPEPLSSATTERRDYPVDALPETMCAAVECYQRYGQQPIELVVGAALAAASLAAQGLVNVARDDHLVGPISLNLLTIAESGERKTSADQRMARPIREWEANKRDERRPEIDAKKALLDAWTSEREGLLNKIKSGAGKPNKNDEIVGLKVDLEAHEKTRPSVPPEVSLFYEDASPAALAESIAQGWPSSALWSDEGGLVVGSHGMRDETALSYFALLNRLWDGHSFERKRTSVVGSRIEGRRITCSLMMQEIVMAQLLSAGGGASRGIGLLARFLMSWPTSTMGSRLYRQGDLDGPELRAFDARLAQLLDHPLPLDDDGRLKPSPLHLAPEAQATWVRFHDDVERELGREGDFCDVADFAAKTAENAARIAAVFHVFEHAPCGMISSDLMEAGAKIAIWHLNEARRLMGAFNEPEQIRDGIDLMGWIKSRGGFTTLQDVLQRGPNRLRTRKRRDAALKLLYETHNARERTNGGKTIIEVRS